MTNISSWVILDGPEESEIQLAEKIESHYMSHMAEGDKSLLTSERLMDNLGYRLEYRFMMHGHTRHLYTWRNNNAVYFPVKEAYVVAKFLQENGYSVVGAVEDASFKSLQWLLAENNNKKMLTGNVFYQNLANGFFDEKTFAGLKNVIDYPNIKEKAMITLAGEGLSGWFSKTQKLLKSYN